MTSLDVEHDCSPSDEPIRMPICQGHRVQNVECYDHVIKEGAENRLVTRHHVTSVHPSLLPSGGIAYNQDWPPGGVLMKHAWSGETSAVRPPGHGVI